MVLMGIISPCFIGIFLDIAPYRTIRRRRRPVPSVCLQEKMPAMTRKLTETAVGRASAPTAGQTMIWDRAVTGFGVRILPGGSRTFWFQSIGHVRVDLIARYNKDQAWEGRCDAFARVSTHVEGLIGPREGAAVIPLRG
jgi:hypothetical protein